MSDASAPPSPALADPPPAALPAHWTRDLEDKRKTWLRWNLFRRIDGLVLALELRSLRYAMWWEAPDGFSSGNVYVLLEATDLAGAAAEVDRRWPVPPFFEAAATLGYGYPPPLRVTFLETGRP